MRKVRELTSNINFTIIITATVRLQSEVNDFPKQNQLNFYYANGQLLKYWKKLHQRKVINNRYIVFQSMKPCNSLENLNSIYLINFIEQIWKFILHACTFVTFKFYVHTKLITDQQNSTVVHKVKLNYFPVLYTSYCGTRHWKIVV